LSENATIMINIELLNYKVGSASLNILGFQYPTIDIIDTV